MASVLPASRLGSDAEPLTRRRPRQNEMMSSCHDNARILNATVDLHPFAMSDIGEVCSAVDILVIMRVDRPRVVQRLPPLTVFGGRDAVLLPVECLDQLVDIDQDFELGLSVVLHPAVLDDDDLFGADGLRLPDPRAPTDGGIGPVVLKDPEELVGSIVDDDSVGKPLAAHERAFDEGRVVAELRGGRKGKAGEDIDEIFVILWTMSASGHEHFVKNAPSGSQRVH